MITFEEAKRWIGKPVEVSLREGVYRVDGDAVGTGEFDDCNIAVAGIAQSITQIDTDLWLVIGNHADPNFDCELWRLSDIESIEAFKESE